jgi:hypothetical protein
MINIFFNIGLGSNCTNMYKLFFFLSCEEYNYIQIFKIIVRDGTELKNKLMVVTVYF